MADVELSTLTYLKSEIDSKFTATNDSVANNSFDISTINKSLNMQNKNGVDIDTITKYGYYEVDTNLPNGSSLGELRVGYDTSNTSRIIQEFNDSASPYVARRESVDGGLTWSVWVEDVQTQLNDIIQDVITSYKSAEALNMQTSSTTPTDLLLLTIPLPKDGTYILNMSVLYVYDTVGGKPTFSLIVDGVAEIITEQCIDASDTKAISIDRVIKVQQPSTPVDVVIKLQYNVSSATDTLDVKRATFIFERKA